MSDLAMSARAADAAIAPPAAPPLLRASGVTRYYTMGTTRLSVLENCDLELARGEFVAIMGKSGSGKSTLLHILGALDVPQGGQVYFEGLPVFAPPESRRMHSGVGDVFSSAERRRNELRRSTFGFVFQFYHLLPELSVLENVLLPRLVSAGLLSWPSVRRAARRDAEELLARLGLQGRLRHRPQQLSGGERQRVALARALVHRPRVLLADEPTGNLDAEAGESMMRILAELHQQGQSIVMVTHDPSVAARADRRLRLESGRLSEPPAR